jgi:signal transduction histidine kinase
MRWMGSRRVMRGMHWLRGAVRGARAERVLEPVLALLLASLAVLGQIQYSHRNDLALWLDLVTCAASALGAFRPKEGPWVFFAVLLAYLFVPQGWVTLGELSVLIAILGMGIRSQKRLRLILTPLMLAIVVFRSGEGRVLLTPLGFWILAVAAAWLVGDAFARSQDSQRQAVEIALMGQRTRIARDLHDVVAHDLTNVALRARRRSYSARRIPTTWATSRRRRASASMTCGTSCGSYGPPVVETQTRAAGSSRTSPPRWRRRRSASVQRASR